MLEDRWWKAGRYISYSKSVKTSERKGELTYNAVLGRREDFTREINTLVWS